MRNPPSTSSVKQMTPCCSKVGMKRGPWTPEEDELLSNYINREGQAGRWRTLPNRAGLLRCGKSCRLRWMNYLRPSVKRGHITPDEQDLILRLHRLLGNRWSLIAGRIPGRTDNEIKNYWNTHLSKKLISQGIDPRTHKPLLPSISQNPFTNTSTTTTTRVAADPHNNKTYVGSSNSKALPNSLLINMTTTTTTTADLDEEPTNKNEENQEDYRSGMDLDNQYDQSGTKAKGHLIMSNGDDDEETNYKLCANDDAFSSFLSSLVNCEELYFNSGGQQQQHDDHEPAACNAMVFADSTASHAFAFGAAGWDAPIMASSQAAFTNHEHDPMMIRESEINAEKH